MSKKRKPIFTMQNPASDVLRTFKGTFVPTTVMVIVSLILGTFLSGLVYQYVAYTFGKMRRFAAINSFYYGINRTFIVSLIIACTIFYSYYKVLRMFEGHKIDYDTGIIKSDKETFGGAHWQVEEELQDTFHISKKIADTTDEIFGQDEEGRIYGFIYPPGMNHNKLLFGAPGSGKTASVVKTDIYQALLRGESVITTDSKGSVYEETSAVAKELGAIVKVLNLKDKEFNNSNGWNCMSHLDPNSSTFSSDCAVVANIIMKNVLSLKGNEAVTDYWETTETTALQMTIMLLASRPEYIQSGQNNLYGVFLFLSTKTLDELRAIFTSLPLTNPTRVIYSNFAKADIKNQGQTINGLTGHLKMLNDPILGQVLSHNEIDLTLPMKKKCIYYVIMQDNDDTYKFIASLFFSTIFKAQCDYSDALTKKEKDQQLTVNYILDEYRSWGGINDLDKKASTVRSRKISLTIILQLLNQLMVVHGEDGAKEILNDSTVKGLLSTNDLDTATYISDIIGDYTVISESERYDEAKTDAVKGHNSTKKGTEENKRRLVLPEELMNDKMPRDDVIYVIANKAPVRLKKCFAEKSGVLIHPCEIRSAELGYRKSNRYRPKWRREIEEAKANVQATTLKPVDMKQQSSPTFEADNNTPAEKPKVVLREITDTPEKASEKPKEIKGKPELSAADKLNMLLNGDL